MAEENEADKVNSNLNQPDLDNIIETIEDLLNKTENELNKTVTDDNKISINALDLANESNANNNNINNNKDNDENDNKSIKQSITSLNSINDKLEENSSQLASSYEQEISRLKDLIKTKESENLNLDLKLNENEQQYKATIEQLHLNFTQKLEQTLKKFQDMQKDKTSSMVMKYAEAEKKCIDLNRSIELANSKLNDSLKEKQRINETLAKSKKDYEKLNLEFESKMKEIMQLKQENSRMKEQFVICEAKEKAANLKLKSELEAGLSSKRLILQLNAEINELNRKLKEKSPTPDISTGDEVPSNQDLNKQDENTEEKIASETIDVTPARSQSVSPIPHPTAVQVQSNDLKKANIEREKMIRELQALKSQLKDMFEERTTLRDRLQSMENERKMQEISLNKFKETIQNQKQMNKELLNEILHLRELQETLTKEQEEKNEMKQKLTLLTTELNDIKIDLSKSQEKQAELLEFTSKLTEKNTQLQSENTNLTEKLEQIEKDLKLANDIYAKLKEVNDQQKDESSKILNEYEKKINDLSSQLEENIKKVNELTVKLADEQDENVSIKKKNAANIKDLTRQLQTLQKKVSSSNSSVPQSAQSIPSSSSILTNKSNEQTNHISRTSSFSSLNDHMLNENMNTSFSVPVTNSGSLSSNKTKNNSNNDDTRSITSETNSLNQMNRNYNEVICGNDDVYVVDIDKQKIIEKVVTLQKTLAKRNEKIDFLQDHVNQLTLDLQRKTRIIQAYAMSEEVGTFTSEAQDAIKREMSRKTGIMSALYKTNKSYFQTTQFINSNQSNMTMELCLEINGKLQALLEDTLIKNLTLKESLETLGQEIARLSQENRRIRSKE